MIPQFPFEEDKWIITDIKDLRTGASRTDGRYPLRIGSTVIVAYLEEHQCALLQYVADKDGNEKEGLLRTSIVHGWHFQGMLNGEEQLEIRTMNSLYILNEAHDEKQEAHSY